MPSGADHADSRIGCRTAQQRRQGLVVHHGVGVEQPEVAIGRQPCHAHPQVVACGKAPVLARGHDEHAHTALCWRWQAGRGLQQLDRHSRQAVSRGVSHTRPPAGFGGRHGMLAPGQDVRDRAVAGIVVHHDNVEVVGGHPEQRIDALHTLVPIVPVDQQHRGAAYSAAHGGSAAPDAVGGASRNIISSIAINRAIAAMPRGDIHSGWVPEVAGCPRSARAPRMNRTGRPAARGHVHLAADGRAGRSA